MFDEVQVGSRHSTLWESEDINSEISAFHH